MDDIAQDMRVRSTRFDQTPRYEKPPILKLLLPVDATERSRWSVQYVTGLLKGKARIEAHLLFVAEPVTSWQVLRFWTRAEVAAFQRKYGQSQLEDAAGPLRHANVAVFTHYREGNVVFEILDCAEQIGCDRIVLPQPRPRWINLFSRDVVREVLGRAPAIQVVTVDLHGVDRTELAHALNSDS